MPEGADVPRASASLENDFFKVAYTLSESPKICIPGGFAAGAPSAREALPDEGR
jgi:hypothetical protein